MTNLSTDLAVQGEGFFDGASLPVAGRRPAVTRRRCAVVDGAPGPA